MQENNMEKLAIKAWELFVEHNYIMRKSTLKNRLALTDSQVQELIIYLSWHLNLFITDINDSYRMSDNR